ncbi:MAG: protein phosphatase 2C domain-containing protein [Novosphingobium sp.]|nr:protein phosphatase 2C domain-containing protein [Novosphingobium sp.]
MSALAALPGSVPQLPVLGRRSVVDRATHVGARENNEDYVLTDEAGSAAIIVVADGVGGEPWGEHASRLACVSAISFTRRALRAAELRGQAPVTRRIVQLAFRLAYRSLRREARQSRRVAGLKTTLILAVAERATLTFGHVGDGGLWLGHCDGSPLEALLNPMRWSPGGELTSALGPTRRTEPIIGVRTLPERAIVVAATDGLADPIPAPSWQFIAAELVRGDDMQIVMQQLLEHCAGMREEGQPVFTDNMTLAAIRRA